MVVKILSPHKLLKVYKKDKNKKNRQKNTHKKPQKKTKVEMK